MFCSPHMANLSHTQVIYNRIRFVLLVDNDGYNRGGTYQTIESPIKQIFAKAHKYIGKYCTMHTSLAPTTSVTTTTFLERAIGGLFFSSKRKTIRLQHPLTRLFLLNERRVTSGINRSSQKLAVSRGLGVLPEGGVVCMISALGGGRN